MKYLTALLFVAVLGVTPVEAASAVEFDIPGGDASDMIWLWGAQAEINVLFEYRIAAGVTTQPVKGRFEPLQALLIMLRLTDLRAEYTTATAVAVFEPEHYCHPEWGAAAPLPPCVQPPLAIRAGHP